MVIQYLKRSAAPAGELDLIAAVVLDILHSVAGKISECIASSLTLADSRIRTRCPSFAPRRTCLYGASSQYPSSFFIFIVRPSKVTLYGPSG